MKIWTTKDLLYKILEFIGMVPNTNEWNENSLRNNPPSLIRFRRLSALLKAFEYIQTEKKQKDNWWITFVLKKEVTQGELTKDGIIHFLQGDFILKSEFIITPKIQEFIEKEKSFESDSFNGVKDVYTFYKHLMRYRIEIENVLQHNSGILEASSLGFRSSISLTAKLNKDLNKKVDTIDELLFEIINPKNLSFKEETLIQEFGFPKEDLDEIDMEYY